MNLIKHKRCPRCNTKTDIDMVSCPSCQLNYNKFLSATNAEAKLALREGESDKVLMRKGCPNDINKIKLLLITIFLGLTGAHLYYVGRTKQGIFYTMFFIIGFLYSISVSFLAKPPQGDLWQVFTFLSLIWGVVLVMWLFDIINIIFNKFKIPVSIKKQK